MSQDLETIYGRRFAGVEKSRNQVWQVLSRYFQRWVKQEDVVLDVGAGFCEFINNIPAKHKFALDLNPVTLEKAGPDVTVISQDITQRWQVDSSSVDVVFSSNFFEHLPTKDALQSCLKEIHRVLRPNGRLLIMGPNIRFCFKEYWDFFDHFLPLSDRSMAEALEITGFRTEKVIAQFLPYTMSGKLSPNPLFVRLYLALPIFWRLLGKQFLILARKTQCPAD